MLNYIHLSLDLPWMLLGDFNKVLHQHEHLGLTSQSHSQMEGSREVMDVCGLADLGYKGKWWTYEKRVAGGSYSRMHLDRAVATSD
jgi:hypothetical protein